MKRKQRSLQQMMEEQSSSLIRDRLPKEWVIHEYKPDYGIDYVVEVFKYLDGTTIAETLGELFLVQLKSQLKTETTTLRVYCRGNVEKGPLVLDKTRFVDIPVLKYDIEVSELNTVQALGHGIPVILLLAALDRQEVYYLCLNDYIDKVILPSDEDFYKKKTKTLSIPLANKLDSDGRGLAALRFYAQRMKLLAAFHKLTYQAREMDYLIDFASTREEFVGPSSHMLRNAMSLDIWRDCELWGIMTRIYEQMQQYARLLADNTASLDDLKLQASCLWPSLPALGSSFQEMCREWYLPTELGHSLSLSR